MRRRLLPILIASLLALVLGAPALGAGPIVRFRPNLQTLTPTDLELVTTPNGKRQLRLANEVSNLGRGPVEFKPRKQDCDHDGKLKNDRTAYQRIYEDSNGNGAFDRDIDTTFHQAQGRVLQVPRGARALALRGLHQLPAVRPGREPAEGAQQGGLLPPGQRPRLGRLASR